MPPKAKYTKVQIIETAFNLVRESGANELTARGLAKALGTSTGTLFSVFNSVSEIQAAVVKMAKGLYTDYISDGISQTIPFKGAGLKYIQFAKDEPELFKLLFMTGDGDAHITNYLPAFDDNTTSVLTALECSWNIDEEKAKNIYNHLSVYAYGFAALFAQKIHIFTMDDIDRMMTELFNSLIKERSSYENNS